ncbi:acyltransferase family protein [Olivibacter sitiensis]|uniref:acyltransferase family protein n=1 Tax=Olivibacter sitiensis TaxID=376470 RepID=UPI00041BCC27|nr:acyltransferase [Olivibacter sitiensis]
MNNLLRYLPQKLQRVTSGRKIIYEIDGLRFLSIFPVLVQHLSERFERHTNNHFVDLPIDKASSFVTSRGFLGIYIFFVISGFILVLPFASHYLKGTRRPLLKDYYWRRLTRLEPPFLFWMSVLFVVFLLVNHASFLKYIPHFLASISYTHTVIFNKWSPFNPSTWTLEIEIQFYIIAPFLARMFFCIKKNMVRRGVLIGGLVGFMVVQQLLHFYANPWSFNILGHLHYFLLGFLLADIYLLEWQKIRRNHLFDILTLVAGLGLLFSWSWSYELASRLLVIASLFLLFCSVFKGIWVNRFVVNPWVTSIGGMCYTIYLIHLPLAELMVHFTKDIHVGPYFTVNLLFQLALFLPFVLVVGTLGYLVIEKPCMDKDWPLHFKRRVLSLFANRH